jgi:hypothetical protein
VDESVTGILKNTCVKRVAPKRGRLHNNNLKVKCLSGLALETVWLRVFCLSHSISQGLGVNSIVLGFNSQVLGFKSEALGYRI